MTPAIRLADRWAAAVGAAAAEPGPLRALAEDLHGPAAQLLRAVDTGVVDTGLGRTAAAVLIAHGFRTPAVLGPTVRTVVEALTTENAENAGDAGRGVARAAAVAAALAEGIALAQQAHLLAEQEDMHRAAVAAVRAAEAERRISEARFRALFAQAAVGIGIVDERGHVLDGNSTWADMMGRPIEEMRGRPMHALIRPGSAPAAVAHFRELLAGTSDQFRLEFTHEGGQGEPMEMDLSVSRVRTTEGEPDFLVGVALDVTDRRRLQDRLWHEARHDPLTLLPNRTLFLERLQEWLAGTETGGPVGVCYIDLDGFKNVNDSLGHEAGDQLLVQVAARLSAALAGTGSLLARLGGDEFGVICRPADRTDPGTLAERVLAALAEPITLGGRDLTMSASIGVVDTSTAGTAPDVLMRAADISLYLAKARGRGRWQRHDPLNSARQVTRHTLATEMAAALAHGEFRLEYQPLVSLHDGRVRRVEALLRWRHPRLGLLPPQQFITIAEDDDLICPLGLWVLQEACGQAGAWRREHPHAAVGVNVNVSVRQLCRPGFADEVRAVLARSGLPPHALHLELTESAVLGDAPGPLDVLGDLSGAGIRLAIDDFGTGYSNLAHLGRLPVSELKLAGSFLDATPLDDQATRKIVPAVISLAHSLGLTVTAEGVETAEQADRLRELSCDEAQGWYFAAPGPADEIGRLLASARPNTDPGPDPDSAAGPARSPVRAPAIRVGPAPA